MDKTYTMESKPALNQHYWLVFVAFVLCGGALGGFSVMFIFTSIEMIFSGYVNDWSGKLAFAAILGSVYGTLPATLTGAVTVLWLRLVRSWVSTLITVIVGMLFAGLTLIVLSNGEVQDTSLFLFPAAISAAILSVFYPAKDEVELKPSSNKNDHNISS
ncbi:TPA: hypothetical protein QB352_000743 [Pasteurella multocida]|nr:hypothetical protein [Pasteurella multocida]